MRKVDTNVKELVGMIERGELRLPEMQRRYVWRAPRVRDLLDSLYRGYPSGSVLVWETDQEQPTRGLAVDQRPSPFAGHKLLLDGQQRLIVAYLDGLQAKVDSLKALPAQTAAELDALLPSILDRAFKGDLA